MSDWVWIMGKYTSVREAIDLPNRVMKIGDSFGVRSYESARNPA
jgi:hypothetical protein